jgi:BsuBI/PstI restriction endonuclease domain/BsuBI/PstI restriction endonuclease HTH domain
MSFPPLLGRETIRSRLQTVFPEGTPERDKCVREAAAATVFTMLYVGAVEGARRWLGPAHVVRMGDERADSMTTDEERAAYGRRAVPTGARWYAENSREQVRDEVLRQGLIPVGAVIERPGLATTAGVPRYALEAAFAALFVPELADSAFEAAAEDWRLRHLSAAALARVRIMRRSAASSSEGVVVRFPNDETRRMAAGPSSEISRAVIEEFAPRFLIDPAVLWLSESATKVVERDDQLAKDIGLTIESDRNLPDIILVDRGTGPTDFLLVFVEVVATDGPVTQARVDALGSIAAAAGFAPEQVAFVTAYLDRVVPPRAGPCPPWHGDRLCGSPRSRSTLSSCTTAPHYR